jgi:hypothetical protein
MMNRPEASSSPATQPCAYDREGLVRLFDEALAAK